jgi:hypothetical protein
VCTRPATILNQAFGFWVKEMEVERNGFVERQFRIADTFIYFSSTAYVSNLIISASRQIANSGLVPQYSLRPASS